MKLETLILSNLVHNEEYLRKVIPFIRDDYFVDTNERKIFIEIRQFVDTYNAAPSIDALSIMVQNNKSLTEDEYSVINEVLHQLQPVEKNKDWLLIETEKFCKEKAVYNAIVKSIQIIDGKDTNLTTDGIPALLQEALSVCFDNSVGHDYLLDSSERFDFYHRVEEKLPFDLELFNKITCGGISRKSLNIALAGTGVGKSLFMCHVAASAVSQGKNVLYITMEMAEEKIAERIDANLLNVAIDALRTLPKKMFEDRIAAIKRKTEGRLIIKEYPTASAHAGHFRALLNELNLKKQFVPDVIFIDYLNICASSRQKLSNNVSTYTYIKSIAEELRGLAVEFDVPIFSATQTTRSGFANSDVELTDTAESFGLPATADFMFALISTEDLERLGQIMVKQLKNRYEDLNKFKRFVIGVDKSKMKLYDLDMSAQKNITEEIDQTSKPPVFAQRKQISNKNFDAIKF